SSRRQHGVMTRGRDRKSAAVENVSAFQPWARTSSSNEVRTDGSPSTTKTVELTSRRVTTSMARDDAIDRCSPAKMPSAGFKSSIFVCMMENYAIARRFTITERGGCDL